MELLVPLQQRLEQEATFTRGKEDWSIREKVSHDCRDCEYLKQFLSSPTERRLCLAAGKGSSDAYSSGDR